MHKLSDILIRLRNGETHNEINQTLGVHKTVLRRLRTLAEANNWLSLEVPLPDDFELKEKYNALFPSSAVEHPLKEFHDDIRAWREADESFAVILIKINQRLAARHVQLNSDIQSLPPVIKDTRLRDYVHKHFPKLPKHISRRELEYGVAEMDFGFLGRCADTHGMIRKTWFLSVRFRFSRATYREYLLHTDIRSVIDALIRAFEFFGAVPERLVIDNFKAAVARAHLTDPTLTQSFRDFSKHYGILIEVCRPYSPQHKGGVENDVKYVKRNFLPLLKQYEKDRGHELIRLSSINERFRWWNETITSVRRIREMADRTPADLFREEFNHLNPLVQDRHVIHEYAENLRVHADGCVRFDTVRYSVPYQFIGRTDARIRANSQVIDVFFGATHAARHLRSFTRGAKVKKREHRREASEEYVRMSKEQTLMRAALIGERTRTFVNALLTENGQCNLRAARGVVLFTKKYSPARVEEACARAIDFDLRTYQQVKNILEKNLEGTQTDIPADADGQMRFTFIRSGVEYKNILKEMPLWTHSHN
jgi:hypothetical protein